MAIADDFNIIGPPREVLRTVQAFAHEIKDSGLEIRREKCGILWPHASPVPSFLRQFSDDTHIPIITGAMETLGSIVGFDEDKINKWLDNRVDSFDPFFDLLSRDDFHVQTAMLLLRQSAAPSLGHLARVIPPTLLEPYARRFDQRVIGVAATKLAPKSSSC